MKKYKFTGEKKTLADGTVLRQIVSIRRLPSVKKGTIGGWIESELNLSHASDCWVYHEAMAYGYARVREDARLCDYSRVYDYGIASGFTRLFHQARVYQGAWAYGRTTLSGNTRIFGTAEMFEDAFATDNSKIFSNAQVGGNARVLGKAKIGSNRLILEGKHVK